MRSKVLQAIYAGRYEGDDTIMVLKAFEYHIAKLNELGVLQVALLPKFVEVGVSMLEEGKKKFRPTEEDRNPSMKMGDNEFVRRMTDNFELKRHIEQWGGCWETHEDLIKEAFMDFRKTTERISSEESLPLIEKLLLTAADGMEMSISDFCTWRLIVSRRSF